MRAIVQNLFFLHKIYTTKAGWSIFTDYLVGALGLILFAPPVIVSGYWPLLVPLWAVWGFMLIRSVSALAIARRRVHYVRQRPLGAADMSSKVSETAVQDELQRFNRMRVIESGIGWQIFEMVVDIYRRTKYGTYLSRQIYYSVFEGRLRRAVPNVLFDSKFAKGRQFKYMYLQSQRLSLEGGLDDIFTAYAPDHYKIDSLSFVSPEVLIDIQAAQAFDIEIVGDRVFLYGPLLLDQGAVDNLQTLGNRLTAAINDNIDTYADSYLVGPSRRQTTTAFARQLLESPVKPLVKTIACLLIAIGAIGTSIYKHNVDIAVNEATMFVYIILLSQVWLLVKVLRENRRIRASFAMDRKVQAWAAQHRPFSLGQRTQL